MATKTSPFIPSFLRATLSGSRPLTLTFSEVSDTNIASTSSFIYDPPNAPLKSTQQLNVDWTRFENHTFFMSAEAKVNLAFDQVINGFPFDGTRQETEVFFEKLTGFDRHVFDSFPKFHGELLFSGTQIGEDVDGTKGTFIAVTDHAGGLFPDISKNRSGDSIINPKNGKSLSIEMQLFIPKGIIAGTQVVCQKLSGKTQGFSLYLVPDSSTTKAEARFSIVSGSTSVTVPAMLDKGKFNHICVMLNRDNGVHYLEFFNDATSVAISKTRSNIGDMDIDASIFVIGSGTQASLQTGIVTPTQTLSGVIDEFRLFHSARSVELQQLYAPKSIFATDDLKLYYKFNEPPPPLVLDVSDAINSIVIDSSGNSLHALVSNFTGSLRMNASLDATSNVIFEKQETVPVLFPSQPDVIALNVSLLASASAFDRANPNLITRLVPQHYLLEGAAQDGFAEPEGDGGNQFGGNGIPGQGSRGGVQMFLSLLYIWARFFDEMKLFIDSFSTLKTVSYDGTNSVPNNFILELVKQYGFHLPPLFNDSTLEQYVRAENIGQEISSSETPLKFVQHELMRRVMVNLPDVLKSKGTQHSIKSFLRAVGIDPENNVKLREYGGPTSRQLSFSRETKHEIGTMVEFASSSYITSPFLSASRVEAGFPQIAGAFVQQQNYHPNGISNNPNDGLLTSGSWTWETIVKHTPATIKNMTSATQSLVRFCVTGSMSGSVGIIANLLAISSSIEPKLVLYVRSGDSLTAPTLRMSIDTPANAMFDGNRWNVSFGVERNDSVGSRVSSSYFLRLANQNNGEISYFASTSSFFYETLSGGNNVFRSRNVSTNASGSFITMGSSQLLSSGTGLGYLFLNDVLAAPSEARTTDFNGLQSNARLWSKALSEDEYREHVKNYRSLGVEDPSLHYNFVNTTSGSFEKVRIDSLAKQETRRAIATASLGVFGSITFLDFSLHGLHLTGSGFPIDKDCLRGEIFDLSYLSPSFDEAVSSDKIRIRSYQDIDLVNNTPWAGVAPVHEIVKSEQPTDDVSFAVDFSLIDVLNRDIVTLFATYDAIDNALGSPEMMYSQDYPDMSKIRDVYFNRLQEKLNFKAYFEYYRWFDVSISSFIEQLIPKKTNFRGTNFVIESHMLERHKLEYQSADVYLDEATRPRITDNLLLQEIDGTLSKH